MRSRVIQILVDLKQKEQYNTHMLNKELNMKQVTRTSSTGGTITEFFDAQGNRTKVVHKAGSTYSGKIAQVEAKKA